MTIFLSDFKKILIAFALPFIMYGQHQLKQKELNLVSKEGKNEIILSLNQKGELAYKVKRNNAIVIGESPLGLVCENQNFTEGLEVVTVSDVKEKREVYSLQVGNNNKIDHLFTTKSISFKNKNGALLIVDLKAGQEGVAFRYRLPDESGKIQVVEKELTGFQIEKGAKGWLQPYNKAGKYTPGYEDFYLHVTAGDSIEKARNPSVGWCMPALFNVNNKKNWVLIAESGTDGNFPGCHLAADSHGGLYSIEFAKQDERYTLPIDENADAKPKYKTPWTMPWRVIITGNQAGDILLSTLITDLAPASKIEDTSWIEPGKAAWSWWSHPDDFSAKTYNDFTDLSASFGFNYTLFDAGWEKANQESGIIKYAASKGIKPLVWGYSSAFFEPKARKKRFRQLVDIGVKGVKIDFWCSDRQEVMGALQGVFEDAAKEHLLVNLHGTTVPRGWHRTWPNFMTAEAILGTESYFYEPRFPEKAAEQNTVLPFTRNVAGPADYTPFALTMRTYPRLNTAIHELATAMTLTSGIIHFADSKEVFDSLPIEVKNLLKEMPATWDRTESIIAKPGEAIVLYRQNGSLSYIVGINGTNEEMPVSIDLKKYGKGFSKFRIISEGKDPLMEFKMQSYPLISNWKYNLVPKGGFIIQFIK
ncbi:glycoside hydrolase family 97 protein [Flavobacterium daejeonense]|uniref:glycoside hydrolase family 97 protein n=1 Tax=Flavobacterium daejeonense TaxID=350893 RepID=UPI000556E7A4|nr:glycoside hydrolase family 97 protein [Flavobacterium daejeonense]